MNNDKSISGLTVKVKNLDELADIGKSVEVGLMLSWRGCDNWKSILRFDKNTNTILVDKQGLLRAIQLLCPRQPDGDIRLVDGLVYKTRKDAAKEYFGEE